MAGKKKKYYRIGEVSSIAGVEPHIIRYWESLFSEINPRRISGQRFYRSSDIELIVKIKKMLREDGLTVAGVRKRLSGKADTGKMPDASRDCMNVFRQIRSELLEIMELLE